MCSFISVSYKILARCKLLKFHSSCNFLHHFCIHLLHQKVDFHHWHESCHFFVCLRDAWNLNIADGWQVNLLENRGSLAIQIFSSWHFLSEVTWSCWLVVTASHWETTSEAASSFSLTKAASCRLLILLLHRETTLTETAVSLRWWSLILVHRKTSSVACRHSLVHLEAWSKRRVALRIWLLLLIERWSSWHSFFLLVLHLEASKWATRPGFSALVVGILSRCFVL